jgi:chromosome partitioning protein
LRPRAAVRALVLADTVLVPVQPRGLDVWALGQVSALVETANASRGGLRALAVLNLADPGTSADNTDAAAARRRGRGDGGE